MSFTLFTNFLTPMHSDIIIVAKAVLTFSILEIWFAANATIWGSVSCDSLQPFRSLFPHLLFNTLPVAT
jgi:hypothetical protein